MSEELEQTAPSEEMIETARKFVRLAKEHVGPLPEGCQDAYTLASTAIQLLIPALGEVDDVGDMMVTVQGLGAGLRAYTIDSPPVVCLAIIRDMITGMLQTEVSHREAAGPVSLGDLLASVFVTRAGKDVN